MKSINTINNIRQIVVNTIESKIDVIFLLSGVYIIDIKTKDNKAKHKLIIE